MNHEEMSYIAHYGVPGMKWGHRKAQIRNAVQKYRTNKAERLYKRAGYMEGKSRYHTSKARENSTMQRQDAKTARAKQAQYNKQGKKILGGMMGHIAKVNERSEKRIMSNSPEAQSARASKTIAKNAKAKADRYANKKNINLGKDKVKSIMSTASKAGYKEMHGWDDKDVRTQEYRKARKRMGYK